MPSDIFTWAQVITSPSEVPIFEPFITALFSTLDSIPYIIYAPSDFWGNRKTNPKLICLTGDAVYYYEQIDNEIIYKMIRIENIMSIEKGTILLMSWIKINALCGQDEYTLNIEFNTVVETIFKTLLDHLRMAISRLDLAKQSEQLFSLHCINHLTFKFVNFAKHSLLENNPILAAVFQPSIMVKHLRIFRKIVSTAHLHILTNTEIIIIEEDNKKSKKKVAYGCIWTFFPLRKVTKLLVHENIEGSSLSLTIYQNDSPNHVTLYSINNKDSIISLIQAFNKLKSTIQN